MDKNRKENARVTGEDWFWRVFISAVFVAMIWLYTNTLTSDQLDSNNTCRSAALVAYTEGRAGARSGDSQWAEDHLQYVYKPTSIADLSDSTKVTAYRVAMEAFEKALKGEPDTAEQTVRSYCG